MDDHIKSLAKLCRICRSYVKSSKSLSPKEKYAELLLKVHGINIAEDQEAVHPPKLCVSCRLKMTRYDQERGPHPERSTAVFTPHEENCSVFKAPHASAETHSTLLPQSTSEAPSTSASESVILARTETASTSYRPIKSKAPEDVTRNLFNPRPDEGQKRRVWSAKDSLHAVGRDYARKRMKGLNDSVVGYCEANKEEEIDVLFFLLEDKLFRSKDQRHKPVSVLWKELEESKGLSVDDCLAMRVGLIQTKGKYTDQYNFFKSKGQATLKPPSALDDREALYMPGSVRFGMMRDSTTYIHHTPVKPDNAQMEQSHSNSFEPQLIGGPGNVREFAEPNCIGVAWSYREAVAKTLEEMDPAIAEGLIQNGLSEETQILTTIKDGADGMGDITVHRGSSDTYLPDKAFRASFAILKCEGVRPDGSRVLLFEEEKPNAVQVNRPILEAIGDENRPSTSAQLLRGIEWERKLMQGQTMKIYTAESSRSHTLKIFNSMIDEKLDRADGGLQGSGSRYLCTLCHATRESAKSQIGSFHIDRTYQETVEIGSYLEVNPDKLSTSELSDMAKGIKGKPILLSEPSMKLLDATHADINLGQFFKKLIVKEVAAVQVWEVNQSVKEFIDDAEKRLNDHLRSTIGLAPTLMMPGNYARALFDPNNEAAFLELIPNEERKEHLKSILEDFRFLRKVYRSRKPDPEDVKTYKQKAVSMGKKLITNFNYVSWPNYLHKIIEHVQEILENPEGPGSVGALSGEGSEAANKLFRYLRLHASRRGNVTEGLRDILWSHWLFTSPKLRRLRAASLVRRKYHCSNCGGEGHSKTTCSSASTSN